MSGLTWCLKKAGSALKAEDKYAILASAHEYRAQGLSAKEAGIKAIDDLLGDAKSQVAALFGESLRQPAASQAPVKPGLQKMQAAKAAREAAEIDNNPEDYKGHYIYASDMAGGQFLVRKRKGEKKLGEMVGRSFLTKESARAAVDAKLAPKPEIAPAADKPKKPNKPAEARAERLAKAEAATKIEDFGEKIGGARKDTAMPGVKTSRPKTTDDRPAWMRRFQISQIAEVSGVRDAGRWVIRDTRSLDWMKRPRQVGRETYTSQAEAEAILPLAAVALKHRAVPVSTPDGQKYEIWRDITDRKRVKVIDKQFDTRDQAMDFMAKNAEQIIEANTTFGEADLPVPENKQRIGAARRQGDVTGEDIQKAFGFRGVEFGNWNNQAERQEIMNEAYDGLLDLAEVMDIPPKAISMNGELALAFGARGHGLSGARAHYEPERSVINLTKMKGAGALAHEWFHALDHYFGRKDGKASSVWVAKPDGTRVLKANASFEDDAATGGFSRRNSGVRAEVQAAYGKLMNTIVKKAEQYVEDTARVDKFVAAVRDDVEKQLVNLRRDLAEQKDPKYWKRNNKPATADQLAQFDAIAKQILDGVALDTELRPATGNKTITGMRWTNDGLEQLSGIYKAVRGRSGFDGTNRDGILDRLRQYMGLYSTRLKMLADAQNGQEKTKQVPTDFAMDAKSLDQGRGTNYWTTPHEMAARAFQGYVEDKIAAGAGRSPFLNYGPETAGILTPWGWKRPYPAGEERKAINAALDELVATIETVETDQGVALFSRAPLKTDGHNGLLQKFRALKGEALPETAARDAADVLGFRPDVRIAQVNDQNMDRSPMWYSTTRKVIEYNTAVEHYRASDAQFMVEEFIHAMDATGPMRAITAGSPRFLSGGDLRTEIEAAFARSQIFRQQLSYPLNEDIADGRKAVELFARVGVIYHAFPQALQALTPKTYEAYRGIFNDDNLPAEVRADTRGDAAGERDGLRLDGAGAQAGRSDQGGAADQRLDRLVRRIAEVTQADPRGTLVDGPGSNTDSLKAGAQPPAVRNPSTVDRVQAAIDELIGGQPLPNQLGGVVSTTAADIKSTWEPLIGRNVQIGSEGEGGVAQGFYEPGSKTIFLIADQISRGDEMAVLAHELMHKHGQAALGKEGWNKLHDVLNTWKDAESGSEERTIYNYARSKVEAVGAQLSSQEMFPYAVEAAIKMGIKPNAVARQGTAQRWLSAVKQAMQQAWGKITGKPETFKTQDLVDLAFGIAQMENPESAAAIGNNGDFDPANPDIRFSRTGAIGDTLKAITVTDLKAKTGNKMADYRGLGLQFLGGRQLNDLYGKDIPQLGGYTHMVQQMSADANEVGANADNIATSWGRLADEKQLAELMHDATLAQIDPAKDFVPGDNRLQWGSLNAKFKALSAEAKKVYTDARDGYEEHYAQVREAIRDKIERSDMAKPAKAALLERMDGEFFDKIKGVYFPLARFGKYVVVTRDRAGQVVNVSRAETLNEAEATRQLMRQAYPAIKGFAVGKVLKDKEFNAARDGVGRGFLKDLFGMLDEKGVGEELQDAVNQLYLASMPDLSWAKHGIHRKGTPGFSQDARRAFAQNMFHGARYLAKLRYADQLQDKLTQMESFIESKNGDESFNQPRARDVLDELVKRHDSLMNPKSNPLSTALTSFGFVFHLGLSPASAMVNLSQTALVAYPIMGARWGFDKAAAALTVAGKQAATHKNDISKALNGDERRAYDAAVKAGTIDVTNAHDLAGIAQGEDAKVSWKLRPVMKWASFLFHHAERFNRQVTFVASYRLARAAGAKPETAYEQATKATYDGHFDYAASNRPRIMQGNVAKVALLFKQYGQNMVYTLARQAQQAIKAETPEGRAEARKALGGLLVLHASAAGVLGLPMVTTLLAAASMLGGSDDEPWDAEVALRNLLADTFGQKPAEVMARGFSRLTPIDISGRVGLDKLIIPDIQEGLEGQRLAESVMAAALGPVAGIAVNAFKGMQDISDGKWASGLEAMLPAALRGPMKALRYGTDGVKDRTGIVVKDDVGAAGVAGQALGFSPSEVRNAFEGRSAVYAADKRLMERRQDLMSQYAKAVMDKDIEGVREAQKDIHGFNEKNPSRQIRGLQLQQSLRMRAKRIANAENGVYLPRNRRDVAQEGRFAAE